LVLFFSVVPRGSSSPPCAISSASAPTPTPRTTSSPHFSLGPTLARSSPVFSTLFRTLTLVPRWRRRRLLVGTQLRPAVASLLSTGYLWSCTFRLSVLYLRDLCSAGGFRASHDARQLKVRLPRQRRAEQGLPVARPLRRHLALVAACASSCSRPRHSGSRKASTLVTVQLHGVSRRSRQPCAPSCRASRRFVFACLHSQRCVASLGAVNSVVCLANT